jgi:arylsulfatase A-like enzyme/Tfp pilus assembly protein PilF
VRFEAVVSEVPLTLPAHCCLLTGTYPPTHGVHDNLGYVLADRNLTLAEVLKEKGYSTAAFVGAYVLHSKWGLSQGFEYYNDDFPKSAQKTGQLTNAAVERRGGDVRDAALQWLSEQRGDQPFFCWIHLFDPHDPYAGEVAYADNVLGEILEALRKRGLYDKSLIVVVGDHGEGLGEHEELTHGYFLYDPTLLVPLIVKLPSNGRYDKRIRVVEGVFQLVDVFPTVLQVLGIGAPERLQGQGLVAAMLGKRSLSGRDAYSETYYPNEFGWSELKSWRSKEHKYILGPRPELYNLQEDPGEVQNLVNGNASLANQLKTQLQNFEERYRDTSAESEAQAELSPEDLERFRSLGYVGSPTKGVSSRALDLPDPKDKIVEYSLISQAMAFIAREQCSRALPILTQLSTQDPDILSVHTMVGQCYLQEGRYRDALASLERVVEEEPTRVYPRLYLAQAHFHLKEYDQAQSILEEVLKEDPDSFQANNYLGLIYADKGQTARAVKAFTNAVRLQDDAEAYQMLGYLHTREQQPRQAAEALEKAVEMEPENALAHLYLANAYMLLGRRAQGEQEYRKALALDPSLRERLP